MPSSTHKEASLSAKGDSSILSLSTDDVSRASGSPSRERAGSHDLTPSPINADPSPRTQQTLNPARADKQPRDSSKEREALELRRRENQAARAQRTLTAIDPRANPPPPAIKVDAPQDSSLEQTMTEDEKLWKKQVMRSLRSRTISTILSGMSTISSLLQCFGAQLCSAASGVQLRALGIGLPETQPEVPFRRVHRSDLCFSNAFIQDPEREAKALKRTMVVKEIVTTENNYKRDLQIIIDVIIHLHCSIPVLTDSPHPTGYSAGEHGFRNRDCSRNQILAEFLETLTTFSCYRRYDSYHGCL